MSHSFVFLSVAAVASRPGAAGQKDIAQVGLSCAASRKTGAEPGSRRVAREHPIDACFKQRAKAYFIFKLEQQAPCMHCP
eukprot:1161347-Pelagomonas_calceolata.AAC.12